MKSRSAASTTHTHCITCGVYVDMSRVDKEKKSIANNNIMHCIYCSYLPAHVHIWMATTFGFYPAKRAIQTISMSRRKEAENLFFFLLVNWMIHFKFAFFAFRLSDYSSESIIHKYMRMNKRNLYVQYNLQKLETFVENFIETLTKTDK